MATRGSSRSSPIRLTFGDQTVVVGGGAEAVSDEIVVSEGDLALVTQEGSEFERQHPGARILFRSGPFALVPASEAGEAGPHRGFTVRPVTESARVFERTSRPAEVADESIRALVAQVVETRYCDTLAEIAAISRAGLPGYRRAAELLESRLPSSWAVSREGISGRRDFNLIASRSGSEEGFTVVCAHLDARGDDPQGAWGADDNASGCAGLVELARVFASIPLRLGLRLVFFGGEEDGLYGSRHHVSERWEELAERCRAVINLDTVGRRYLGEQWVQLFVRDLESELIEALVEAARTYVPGLEVSRSDKGLDSDHVPFLDEGLQAIMAAEFDLGQSDRDGDGRNDIHTGADRIEFVDCDQGAAITRMVVAYLAVKIL